ncbi:DUF2490 domain-containing protein [Algoriphagus kandeliae]|uniref:DUF2490 domain-containing protein n=1 Tax=Algoriphagus kandeliae TaxID=2562278 RepID=A0A4Y9QZU6_9BACT|nr:DUF2490 domain-containing protein [Algoriphagus kandeliae]TFV97660.1 DUF2490 domain-containing protein [Algoriphagus kandeliae]
MLKPQIQKILLTLLICVFGLFFSKEANAHVIDQQFWFNYSLKFPLTEKISLGGDAGVRGLFTNPDWKQTLIRPTATFKLNNQLSLSGAVAWFGTSLENSNELNEFRLHQGVTLKTPTSGPIDFFYRFRVEERFFYFQENNTFNVRVRGLIGVNTKDITWLGEKRPIFFQSLFEGFQTIDKQAEQELFVNQTRLHFALGHKISKQFRYEFHFISQRYRIFNEQGIRPAQNVLRVRLFHRLN